MSDQRRETAGRTASAPGPAPETDAAGQPIELDDLDPRSSRQQWTRSAVALVDEIVLAGTGNGSLRAFASNGDGAGEEQWRVDFDEPVVHVEPTTVDGETVAAVGTRGDEGSVALVDLVGSVRWQYDTVTDLGTATKETLFYYPFVVDVAVDGEGDVHGEEDVDAADEGDDHPRVYAAARRYERREGDRHFESAVYAFEPDGTPAWRYGADASPIAIDRRDDRLAVAYNRCTGDHQCGLVVLDARSGEERMTWDPGTEGDRRVGDVSLDADGAVVACHGDYRGYALDRTGAARWTVDLGTEVEMDGETVYAYPNHVRADDDGAVFLTGNTFPEEGRDTEARHPREHEMIAVEDGTVAWTRRTGGWVGSIDADGERLAVPCGQHFRDRDPASHALRVVDRVNGDLEELALDGIATAAAVRDGRAVVLEEPIQYHDEDRTRGRHRLHLVDVSSGDVRS